MVYDRFLAQTFVPKYSPETFHRPKSPLTPLFQSERISALFPIVLGKRTPLASRFLQTSAKEQHQCQMTRNQQKLLVVLVGHILPALWV